MLPKPIVLSYNAYCFVSNRCCAELNINRCKVLGKREVKTFTATLGNMDENYFFAI